MTTKFVHSLLLLGIAAIATAGDPPSNFKISTKRKDDTVEVRTDKDKTMFIVKSPTGISQTVIERQEQAWPKTVVLRLHLKALESFRVTNGKTMLDGGVGIQDGKPKVRQWQDGKEDPPLNDKSPLWMEFRMVGGDGKLATALPLKDGYFEVTLPIAFFAGNPKAITVNWIDFYR